MRVRLPCLFSSASHLIGCTSLFGARLSGLHHSFFSRIVSTPCKWILL